ncbi:hypothetical protein M3Y98_00124100 [Aphelenchoides besseyi]|nr:hypothetical protein M3Y98_00124100 [Aphelenchoides besseyi]KAI6199539.1 hypothetical protein M3Y96_00637900 [Aphelenchoides besseyi]
MLKDVCLGNQHVHNGSFIIAIISIVLDVLNVLFGIFSSTTSGIFAVSTANHTRDASANESIWHLFEGVQSHIPMSGPGHIFLYLLSILFAVLLIVGIKKRKPTLYWPFLIWNLLGLIFGVIAVIAMIIGAVILLVNPETLGVKAPNNSLGAVLLFAIALFVLFILAIKFYFFFTVPNRSRKIMVDDNDLMTDRQPKAYVQNSTYAQP